MNQSYGGVMTTAAFQNVKANVLVDDHDEVSSALGSAASPTVRDQVFDAATPRIGDFKFGEQVVSVFDDMVDRSVPFYREMQRMIAEKIIRQHDRITFFPCGEE